MRLPTEAPYAARRVMSSPLAWRACMSMNCTLGRFIAILKALNAEMHGMPTRCRTSVSSSSSAANEPV